MDENGGMRTPIEVSHDDDAAASIAGASTRPEGVRGSIVFDIARRARESKVPRRTLCEKDLAKETPGSGDEFLARPLTELSRSIAQTFPRRVWFERRLFQPPEPPPGLAF